MISRKQKALRAIALFLVYALFQLYVQAGAPASLVQTQDASASQGAGLLSTSGNHKILLNRNDASTGATVLDGATLETPNCVTAIVRLGSTGMVDLATNTQAVVKYGDGQLNVTLMRGCARVIAGPNVEGTITTPDGKTVTATQPFGNNQKRAEVCSASSDGSTFKPSCGSAPLVVGGIIGIAAVAAAVIAAGTGGDGGRGENPSQSTP